MTVGDDCCSGAIPHLWLLGPAGWLCGVGQHGWAAQDPYGPCHAALPWAVAGIRRAEADSGMCVSLVAGSLGIVLDAPS